MGKIVQPEDVSWEEYKNLRLEALQQDPQAFGTSYEEQKHDSDKRWEDRLRAYKKRDGNWVIFASDKNQLIGMMGAFQTDKDKKNRSAEIISVYVKKSFRGKGIAKMMMQTLLDELKQSSISSVKLAVFVEQIPALNLYKRFGFSIKKRDIMILSDGQRHDEYVMEKTL